MRTPASRVRAMVAIVARWIADTVHEGLYIFRFLVRAPWTLSSLSASPRPTGLRELLTTVSPAVMAYGLCLAHGT